MSEQGREPHPWESLPPDDPRRVLARLLYRLPESDHGRHFNPDVHDAVTDFEEAWKEAHECWKRAATPAPSEERCGTRIGKYVEGETETDASPGEVMTEEEWERAMDRVLQERLGDWSMRAVHDVERLRKDRRALRERLEEAEEAIAAALPEIERVVGYGDARPSTKQPLRRARWPASETPYTTTRRRSDEERT